MIARTCIAVDADRGARTSGSRTRIAVEADHGRYVPSISPYCVGGIACDAAALVKVILVSFFSPCA